MHYVNHAFIKNGDFSGYFQNLIGQKIMINIYLRIKLYVIIIYLLKKKRKDEADTVNLLLYENLGLHNV